MVSTASTTSINRRIQSPGLALVFSPEEINQARREGKLLSLDIELTKLCNFSCVYCYAAPGERQEDELTVAEIFAVIDEARTLGLKTVTFTGGEPLLDDKYFPVARYAREGDLSILLFTNGSRITREVAKALMELKVSPCVKLDSLSEKVQDHMAGVSGAYHQIMSGIENLTAAGFTTEYPSLAINATACRENISELPDLWSWARQQGISPSLTRLQLMGRAQARSDLMLTASDLQELFRTLSEIDKQYGYFWEPLIPWHSGKACRRHFIGCFIDSQGNVQPCSGVPLQAGNVRACSLKEIVSTSEIFKQARKIDREVGGACSNCAHNAECYGCRSIAYFSGKGFTGADPLCWHNADGC
jgi:radical SAM protein with 4Fe4S-binding SPASM domain